jgi:hypothetical protein
VTAFLRWFFAFSLLIDRFNVATRGLPRLTPEQQQLDTLLAIVSSVVLVLWALRARGAVPAFVMLALLSCVIEAVAGVWGHVMVTAGTAMGLVLIDRERAFVVAETA